MEIIILPSEQAVAKRSADLVESQIRAFPDTVLGLATGSSPLGLYRELIHRHREHGLCFQQVRTFNLDEYVGIPAEHSQSYRTFMDENLFKGINIELPNTHVPDGMAENPLDAGPAFEKKISEAGGIDLQILGIGTDGHIGFNEPTSSLRSRTRLKTLTKQTVEDNSRFFGPDEFQPKLAITMGIGTILETRRILMIATGENKADAVQDMIEGPISSMCPGSALQLHERVTVILDEASARNLKYQEYYRHVSEIQDDLVKKHKPSDWIAR
jgi:glucosamine-6-phosphate deaminase